MSQPAPAAKSLTTAATIFADPGRATNSTPAVNDSATFHLVVDGSIQTLTTQGPSKGPIRGLLFVPSLDIQDPCNNITAPFIPANVTRFPDVERIRYSTIGLAPWVSAECAKSFLDSSQRSGSDALVFFLPSSNNSKPPPGGDPMWSLSDGWEWESRSYLPVYAIPGPAGATLMHQLSWYSGNTSYAHSGAASVQGPADIRLFTFIDFERNQSKMPSLWGFILAILGTILVLSMIVLFFYQLVQKRRRESLQRRIESGEVDMESLGLHLMKVPQEILDTLPIYTYPDWSALGENSDSDEKRSLRSEEGQHPKRAYEGGISCPHTPTAGETRDHTKDSHGQGKPEDRELSTRANIRPNSHSPSQSQSSIGTCDKDSSSKLNRFSHSQTVCAICLDDFVPHTSTVRELPCGHIFHVECIDASLTRNSCLCPLCKKSVLPPGYYPMPITNRVVHRDYILRRAQ